MTDRLIVFVGGDDCSLSHTFWHSSTFVALGTQGRESTPTAGVTQPIFKDISRDIQGIFAFSFVVRA